MAGLKLVCLDCGQTNRVPRERLTAGAKCGTCGAALLPSKPKDVDPAVLDKAARVDELPMVADFWAPWCGPCRMMAPEFAKAAADLAGSARLVKVNTQDFPEAGQRYGIRGIPTMVAFAGGCERGRQSGAVRAAEVAQFATAAVHKA